MSTAQSTKTVNQASQELFSALTAHRTNPNVMQGVQSLVLQRTGKKLQDYCNCEAPDEEKLALLEELKEIVDNKEWDKLPSSPGGQANATPAAAPKPPKVAAPKVEPTPAPVAAPTVVPLHGPLTPVPRSPIEQFMSAEIERIVAEQLAKLPAPTASVTPEEIRKAVRSELAIVFSKTAEVLNP